MTIPNLILSKKYKGALTHHRYEPVVLCYLPSILVGATNGRPPSANVFGSFRAANGRPYILKKETILDKSRAIAFDCSSPFSAEMQKNKPSEWMTCFMATPNGLEPSTSSVTGWRANRLHHRAKEYSLNSWHYNKNFIVCKDLI